MPKSTQTILASFPANQEDGGRSPMGMRERIALVNSVFVRLPDARVLVPGGTPLTPVELANLDLSNIKTALSDNMDYILEKVRNKGHQLPELTVEQKRTIVDLAVEGIIRQNAAKRTELLIYLESLGFSMRSKNGPDRLLEFWSSHNSVQSYGAVLNAKLRAEGRPGITTDLDIPLIHFTHEIRLNIRTEAEQDARNRASDKIQHAARQGGLDMTGLLSSIYAIGTIENGGTVYVMSRDGLKAKSFFWNAELPILRALQTAGHIDEIRILHEVPDVYQSRALADIGSSLTARDVAVVATFKFLPKWLQDEKLSHLHKTWLDGTSNKALLSTLLQELNGYITQHPLSRTLAMRALRRQVIQNLSELDAFDQMSATDRVNAARQHPMGATALWTVGEFREHASSIFKSTEGQSYQRIQMLLNRFHLDKARSFNFPDWDHKIITLPFHGDMIARYSDQLKSIRPFNLLREQWGLTVLHESSASGELMLSTESGRQCRIQVNTATTVGEKQIQQQQIRAIERFLLVNYTSPDMPEQLSYENDAIKSGPHTLAQREQDGAGFIWRTTDSAVNAVRYGVNNALAGGEAALTWTSASKHPDSLIPDDTFKRVAGMSDDNFHYRKQLIVQLNGDDTSFNAAKNLFLSFMYF
ncbi:hypothetical protein [Chromobacterium piscinae]|uniref:hypothetical protein n=1 Tax=Chromobacterium piscinae TaxID=686831 RepID=UPI003261C704